MILTDVIELSPNLATGTENAKYVVELKDRKEFLEQINEEFNLLDFDHRAKLNDVVDFVGSKYITAKNYLLRDTGTLPDNLIDKNDPLSLAVHCPKINLKEIRRIADKLDFVFIPYQYLKDHDKSEKEQALIDAFVAKLPKVFNPYVLCPIELYDLNLHVESEVDFPVYTPSGFAQTFTAVSIVMPVFKDIKNEVSQIKDNIGEMKKEYENRFMNIKIQLTNINNKIEALTRQIEADKKAKLIQESKIKDLENRLSNARMFAIEPLLVGVPNNCDLTENKNCIVGPCWGPDFDDIVFEVLGLKKIQKQREKLYKQSQTWINN